MPKVTAPIHEPSDIENVTCYSIDNLRVFSRLNRMVWKVLSRVPCIRMIKEKSRANDKALQLVKLLCNTLNLVENTDNASNIYENAIMKAAELGVGDVMKIILDLYPMGIYSMNTSSQGILESAIENRSANVYNLIHQRRSNYSHLVSKHKDGKGNNLLHISAKLGPSHKLDEISGAARQMQRELQWFKRVERDVLPIAREEKNAYGKTPKEVFTKEHKELKAEGEKWMKDTANSCTITAALIATIMFAAAITVPGGNQSDKGYPIFINDRAFIIFIVSDAISLFTSIISLLYFLYILTSRYAEEDFLTALPRRLIIGLATLFISITSMMIAFGTTLFLVSGQNGRVGVLSGILIAACLPSAWYMVLMLPLLSDLISTTCPGIFGKKSNRLLF